MNEQSAKSWIVTGAALTAGFYTLEHLEGTSKTSIPEFMTAWGITWVGLSLAAGAYPRVAGVFAIIITVSDLLYNQAALKAVENAATIHLGGASSTSSTKTPGAAPATPGQAAATAKIPTPLLP